MGYCKYQGHTPRKKKTTKINKKKTSHFFKWTQDLKRYFTKEDLQITDNHIKRCYR